MNTPTPFHPHRLGPARLSRLTGAFFGLLGAALLFLNAAAQSVFVPAPVPPRVLEAPPGQPAPTYAVGAGQPGDAPPAAAAPEMQLQWGPVTAHPRLSYGLTYAKDINSYTNEVVFTNGPRTGLSNNPTDTFIHDIIGGIGLELGRIWRLDYDVTARFYENHDFDNQLNHRATLAGATAYENWDLRFSQLCDLSADPTIQTGTQVDEQRYFTDLSASYRFSRSISVDLGAFQNIQLADGEGMQDSYDWSTIDWLNFHWGPNVSFGLGGGAGYVNAPLSYDETIDYDTNGVPYGTNSFKYGGDMAYEQLQARIQVQVTRKFFLSVSGGEQFRQFLDMTNAPSTHDPIYGASLAYRPFEYTTLSVNGNQAFSTSTLENQYTKTTGWDVYLSQRLFGHITLTLSGGQSWIHYFSSDPRINDERSDDYSYIRADLRTAFLRRGNASLFYSWSKNKSEYDGMSYDSMQVGFQVGLVY